MRRVWASVFSVWALLALVAVLAWTRPPMSVAQQGGRVVVVHTKSGTRRVLVAPAHATTHTSGAARQQQVVVSGQGASAIVSAPQAGGN